MPKKKLIEISLPLEAINAQSAQEESIRYGRPSTLHLWWARRSLATARAVTLLVDDPGENADEYRMEAEAQNRNGHLYPKVELDDDTEANVIAWIWAHTLEARTSVLERRLSWIPGISS
ncbi:DUF1156 domain-containing protein [uncultured Microbacterium sp.]|uniref:DUF1156 domain-containing protein n=1 Tax=uncultured Microbacterium sp. TaxID=191216 RepID=UPI00260CBE1F|nr:DUF1156 domain-containing protein [uncultured Microbacterium sp.]